jgi:hypothetical protein
MPPSLHVPVIEESEHRDPVAKPQSLEQGGFALRSAIVRLALCAAACVGTEATAAVEQSIYINTFEDAVADLSQWSFAGTLGIPHILSTSPPPPLEPGQGPLAATRFLGEFGGNDEIRLHLPLPHETRSVRLQFDAYLLRTWDGLDPVFGGPDRFAFGYNQVQLLDDAHDTFSDGFGPQTFCPGTSLPQCAPYTGSDFNQKNRLGFAVELAPIGNGPAVGTPMSLVYHFDTGPIDYTGSDIAFRFLSKGLQTHVNDLPATPLIDESWGVDNVRVSVMLAPEPRIPAAMFVGLLLAALPVLRRLGTRSVG